MAVTEEDVRRAFYASADPPLSWWIAELQMEPPALIVADSDSGRLYRVPYRIDGDAVSFDAAAEVASYSEVAAGRADGPVVVYASAEESRDVMFTSAGWDDPDAAASYDDAAWDGDEALYDALYPADEVPAAYAERRARAAARDAASDGDGELWQAVYPGPGVQAAPARAGARARSGQRAAQP